MFKGTKPMESISALTRRFALASVFVLGSIGIAQATPATGIIRFETTGFSNMNTHLVRGSTLRFSNPTASPLSLRIVTWRGKRVDSLMVSANGGMATWKPAHNGVYVFYDAANTSYGNVPIAGADGEKVFQPVADKNSPNFPAPIYGIVAVTNANGGGIPLSSHYGAMEVAGHSTLTGKHQRPFMLNPKDSPWMEVPGGTMTFKPWVLVVHTGTPVHVFNYDGMGHGFFPGFYPVMYINHGKVRTYHRSFAGFILKKNGGQHDITFNKPGLYHILCVVHAYPWKNTYKPQKFFGGFPYVMDAVIMVEPNTTTANGTTAMVARKPTVG